MHTHLKRKFRIITVNGKVVPLEGGCEMEYDYNRSILTGCGTVSVRTLKPLFTVKIEEYQ